MKTIWLFLRWLFWTVIYTFVPRTNDLGAYIYRLERRRPPWQKSRPVVWRNPDGEMWHVHFLAEEGYAVGNQLIRADVFYGLETGRVVGLALWESDLERLADEQREG